MRNNSQQHSSLQRNLPAELAKLIKYLISRDTGSKERWASYHAAKSEIEAATVNAQHLYDVAIKLYLDGVKL